MPTCPFTTGRPGSLATSSGDGGAPAAMRCAANEAIIAPLSVHSRGRGIRSVSPGPRALLGQLAQPRVRRHPAGDQQCRHPSRSRRERPPGQHIGHRLLEARREVGRRRVGMALHDLATAVLSPEKLNANGRREVRSCRAGTRSRRGRPRGRARRSAGRPDSPAPAAARPCRRPRLRRRRGGAEFDDQFAERSHVQQVGVSARHQQADALGQRAWS